MAKKEVDYAIYEKLAGDYIQSKNQTGFYLLKMAETVEEAKNKLSKRAWVTWRKDSRVKLKSTQAKKFITIARACKKNGQLTDLFNKEGIEKTYIAAQIEDAVKQNEFVQEAFQLPLNVKQLKFVAEKIQIENKSPADAIKEVRSIPSKLPKKVSEAVVSMEEFDRLKLDYETLVKKLSDLENQLDIYKKNKKTATEKGDGIAPHHQLLLESPE
jgi:hypothetical protein